jgi:hypothetical protein
MLVLVFWQVPCLEIYHERGMPIGVNFYDFR